MSRISASSSSSSSAGLGELRLQLAPALGELGGVAQPLVLAPHLGGLPGVVEQAGFAELSLDLGEGAFDLGDERFHPPR